MGRRELGAEEPRVARPTAAETETGAAAAPAARGSSWRRNRKRRARRRCPHPAPPPLWSAGPRPRAPSTGPRWHCGQPVHDCSAVFLLVGGRKAPWFPGVLSSLEETPVAGCVLGSLAEIVSWRGLKASSGFPTLAVFRVRPRSWLDVNAF